MAKKNTEGKSFNLSGIYDKNTRTVTHIEKDKTTTYSLDEYLDRFDGLDMSIGATTQIDLTPIAEE